MMKMMKSRRKSIGSVFEAKKLNSGNGMPKISEWEPSMPIPPGKKMPSAETSTIHGPDRHACKFPTKSRCWPALVIAIQQDDPEQMLTLLQDIKADLKYDTAMQAQAHTSTTEDSHSALCHMILSGQQYTDKALVSKFNNIIGFCLKFCNRKRAFQCVSRLYNTFIVCRTKTEHNHPKIKNLEIPPIVNERPKKKKRSPKRTKRWRKYRRAIRVCSYMKPARMKHPGASQGREFTTSPLASPNSVTQAKSSYVSRITPSPLLLSSLF